MQFINWLVVVLFTRWTMLKSWICLTRLKRRKVEAYMCGRDAAEIMAKRKGFKFVTKSDDLGPHIYGTLNGVTIIRVPSTTILEADRMLAIYKS